MREIVTVLAQLDDPIKDVKIPKNLVCASLSPSSFHNSKSRTTQHITTMSRYNPAYTLPVAFPPQAMTDVLAEWLSKKGVTQSHIAGSS